MYVQLAKLYHWTEAQVDATDPDLIEELLIAERAEADEQEFKRKQREQARD